MARSTDPKKLALWQGRFQRFVESGLPVVRFCAAEDVSESSFYYWLKKLGPPMRRQRTRSEDRGARSDGRGTGATGRGVFQPVTVVPVTYGVVVRLPGGTRIEVDAEHLEARMAGRPNRTPPVTTTSSASAAAPYHVERASHGIDLSVHAAHRHAQRF